jgi:hypothetical protein
MERTVLQLDPLRLAVGEKGDDIPIDERHVAQIEKQRLPRSFDDEQLSQLLNILRLHPAAESEHHLTVR